MARMSFWKFLVGSMFMWLEWMERKYIPTNEDVFLPEYDFQRIFLSMLFSKLIKDIPYLLPRATGEEGTLVVMSCWCTFSHKSQVPFFFHERLLPTAAICDNFGRSRWRVTPILIHHQNNRIRIVRRLFMHMDNRASLHVRWPTCFFQPILNVLISQ